MASEEYLRRLGKRCRGMEGLLRQVHDEDDTDEVTRRREMKLFAVLQGVLYVAAMNMVEELFEELRRCEDAAVAGRRWDWQSEPVSGGLPPRFEDQYIPLLLRKLTLAAAAVTSRLTGTWGPPVSVLEELALHLLLEQAQVVVDESDLILDGDWRESLEELLFEDLDVQLLYDDVDDVGAAILLDAVADHYAPNGWHIPFSEANDQAPYVTGDSEPA